MKSPARGWQTIVCASLLLFIAGCGFHLRGGTPLPPRLERIYLQGVPLYSELGIGLKRRLEANGATVLANPKEASATLTIIHNVPQRQVLSVGSAGKVQEYALTYGLQFQVTDSSGEVLLPPQQLELARRYRFDERSLLSAGEQEALLREVLVEEMIQRIMWRLEALSPGPDE